VTSQPNRGRLIQIKPQPTSTTGQPQAQAQPFHRRTGLNGAGGLEELDEAATGEVRMPGGLEIEVEGGRRRWRRRRRWWRREEGEVGLGFDAAERAGGAVVGQSRLFGSVEGAEPDPRLLPWVTNLGGVTAPWTLSHPPVVGLPCRHFDLPERMGAGEGEMKREKETK